MATTSSPEAKPKKVLWQQTPEGREHLRKMRIKIVKQKRRQGKQRMSARSRANISAGMRRANARRRGGIDIDGVLTNGTTSKEVATHLDALERATLVSFGHVTCFLQEQAASAGISARSLAFRVGKLLQAKARW